MSNDWINRESEQLELEQKEYLEKSGNLTWFKAPQGETIIEVMTEYPVEDSKGNYKDKKEFHILVNDVEMLWTVSRLSPIYRQVIRSLKEDKKKIKLIRIGTSPENTKYDLVVL